MNTSFIFSFMFGIITATFTLTAAASSSSSKTKILEQNEFRARQSERIRQQLSDNLSNFHNNITPEPLRINYERLLGFPVPLDLTFKIAEFFDKETFDSFSLCEKRFLKFKRDFYALKLYKFDPNCVFPDHWLNELFSNFISGDSNQDTSTSDKEIHDRITLITIKYISNFYNARSSLSKHVEFAFISFIHEIVFGPDSHIPSSLAEWTAYFCFKLQSHDLPLTKNYYFNSLRERIQILPPNVASYLEHSILIYSFWAQKPSIESQKLFLSQNNEIITRLNQTYKLVFEQQCFDGEIDSIGAVYSLFSHLTATGPSSSNLIEKIQINDGIRSWIEEYCLKTPGLWFMPDLHKLYGIGSNSPLLSYIWSRDHLHPFKYTEFVTAINSHINIKVVLLEIMRAKMPFLVKFEIISELFQTGHLSTDEYFKSLNCITSFNSFKSSLDIDIMP